MQSALHRDTLGEELLSAVKNGDSKQVRAMLRSRPWLVRTKDHSGVSAILNAIYHGHPKLVTEFTSAGAELDFWEACAAGRLNRVKALLKGDPGLLSRRSPDGHTGLALAAHFGQHELARFLIERGADLGEAAPLHAAAARRL